ncbi:hypothetical protein ACIQUB_20345 [Rhizobium sp. NPDC090275]|uniref:hypothetical protein n=1 Tax=Rhizobium sp. NPDC090275 TaxID=3364498 RepID=UPI00383BF151
MEGFVEIFNSADLPREKEFLFPQQSVANVVARSCDIALLLRQAVGGLAIAGFDLSLADKDGGNRDNTDQGHHGKQHHAMGNFQV